MNPTDPALLQNEPGTLPAHETGEPLEGSGFEAEIPDEEVPNE